MKRILLPILFLLGFSVSAQKNLSPRKLYPGLFEQVQLEGIYPDGKSFPDALPKKSPVEIMKDYQLQKNAKDFNLKHFVEENFLAPESHNVNYVSDIPAGIEKHLDTLWTVLKRNPDVTGGYQTSLIPLPNAYIVPGGRFREIYYWDSYFTMLGLKEAGKKVLIKNMVDNFAWLIRNYGFIPNGNRTYYLTRSQPPFFSLMVQLLAEGDPSVKISDYSEVLEKEYAFWMKGTENLQKGKAINHVVKLNDGTVLNRYYDAGAVPREESYAEDLRSVQKTRQAKPDFYRNVRSAAESGWDFSTRWFADGKTFGQIITTDLIPVDLNGLLYNLESVIAIAYKQKGDAAKAKLFSAKAIKRKQAILKYCWNPSLKFFTDYNWKKQQQSKQLTLAATSSLFFKIASNAQAAAVIEKIQSDFLKKGGLLTTLNKSGEQWDNPNAWAPLQWISIAGLRNYGNNKLADTISDRWIDLNVKVFKETGKLMEKYDASAPKSLGGGGEYLLQDGFGWTNGVLLKLLSVRAK
ncbi:alpha,alpha-trehalase TreF [Pedobacter sp. ISL-68]|uniref:alpha,alpha-trehalase TreF n=1 Tax=unclassified Pedobacter TaxID=2628915 RepID=UPI001BE59A4B|nr:MULTISPECIES: alpha,alpha-trehalase TreF [unclassified Pedobacter]MBT2563136.1 alpha,alpha-trehalase TreF [Pedobacter sp. ISL-64]MBT2593474.1 alpha,alpha-trehalase TreF [Pedobacter sp. ISL-68]